jgi:hypothetical protein
VRELINRTLARFGYLPRAGCVPIEDVITAYFRTKDSESAVGLYHHCRNILVSRKLLRKERSDKGSTRVGKLGMPSDVRAIEPAVNGSETA